MNASPDAIKTTKKTYSTPHTHTIDIEIKSQARQIRKSMRVDFIRSLASF